MIRAGGGASLEEPVSGVHSDMSRHQLLPSLRHPIQVQSSEKSGDVSVRRRQPLRRVGNPLAAAASAVALSALLLISFCSLPWHTGAARGTRYRRLAEAGGDGTCRPPPQSHPSSPSARWCALLASSEGASAQQSYAAASGHDEGGPADSSAEPQQRLPFSQQQLVKTVPLLSDITATDRKDFQDLLPATQAPPSSPSRPLTSADHVPTPTFAPSGAPGQKRRRSEESPGKGARTRNLLATDTAVPAPAVDAGDGEIVTGMFSEEGTAAASAATIDTWALSPSAVKFVRKWLITLCGLRAAEAEAHPFYTKPVPTNPQKLLATLNLDWNFLCQQSKAALIPSKSIALLGESLYRLRLNQGDHRNVGIAARQVLASMTGYVETITRRKWEQLRKDGIWTMGLLLLAADSIFVLAESYDMWPLITPWWDCLFEKANPHLHDIAHRTRWHFVQVTEYPCRHKCALLQQLMQFKSRTRPDALALVGLKRALLCDPKRPQCFKQSVWQVFRDIDEAWTSNRRGFTLATPAPVLFNDIEITNSSGNGSRTSSDSSRCEDGSISCATASNRSSFPRNPAPGAAAGGGLDPHEWRDALEANFSDSEIRELFGAADGLALASGAETQAQCDAASAGADVADVIVDSLFQSLLAVERHSPESLDQVR